MRNTVTKYEKRSRQIIHLHKTTHADCLPDPIGDISRSTQHA
jgi:hypothetical protein